LGNVRASKRYLPGHATHGELNQGQGVSAARLQNLEININAGMALFDEFNKSRTIATLALAFTSQKYPASLRDLPAMMPWASHPICGTAPNTPPR
jgi:hypothetical protein